ncbi:hypothetical protein EEB14_04190 [Rhodococcus sp. WS4]|nr:hypothetical protein EEB14_04190 [Rhodococcus sp. WS4]
MPAACVAVTRCRCRADPGIWVEGTTRRAGHGRNQCHGGHCIAVYDVEPWGTPGLSGVLPPTSAP